MHLQRKYFFIKFVLLLEMILIFLNFK